MVCLNGERASLDLKGESKLLATGVQECVHGMRAVEVSDQSKHECNTRAVFL